MNNNSTYNNPINRFIALAKNNLKSDSLDIYRDKAIKELSKLNFPTLKTEEWKYTNLKSVINTEYVHSSSFKAANINRELIENFRFTNFDNYSLVLINGVLDEQLSDFNEINSVTITTLRKALENKDKTALKYFNNIATNKTAFDFLNMANVSEGLFISVDKNIQLKKPLHIINLSVSENAHALIPTRNLIVIGKNSEASIIQSYLGKGDTGYFHTINSEIFIDANAKLNLYKIELENNFANHINKTDVIQKVDSVFRHFNFSFNGKLIRNDINVELEGENIETILNGLYLGNDEQHIDNNTFINHLKPHSTSNELYKGILNDKSHAVFSGKILVEKNAQLTNAYQNNNTILLSDDATVDTKPQLEIYADDVKCTHGATVGQLDESALFYILSRGIPKDKARTMLINAFAESIVSEIPIKELQNEITDLIYNNLHREL